MHVAGCCSLAAVSRMNGNLEGPADRSADADSLGTGCDRSTGGSTPLKSLHAPGGTRTSFFWPSYGAQGPPLAGPPASCPRALPLPDPAAS